MGGNLEKDESPISRKLIKRRLRRCMSFFVSCFFIFGTKNFKKLINMKQIYFWRIFAMLVLFLITNIKLNAHDLEVNNIYYEITSETDKNR